jgi:hypothetical protein
MKFSFSLKNTVMQEAEMRFEGKPKILNAGKLQIFGLENRRKISQHNLEDIRLYVLLVIFYDSE